MTNYVCTDPHGNESAFEQIKALITPNGDNFLYYLGDAADRGHMGYEVMKWLLSNPNVLYLKGNHETIFVDAARAYHQLKNELGEAFLRKTFDAISYYNEDINLHYYNGGESTFKAWVEDGAPMDIIEKLSNLPLTAHYKNFDMCHAGTTIKLFEQGKESDLTWDRNHFNKPWYEGRTLIHGHTPVCFLPSFQNKSSVEEALIYYDEESKKIDLDLGVNSTGLYALYNMDFEAIRILDAEPEK